MKTILKYLIFAIGLIVWTIFTCICYHRVLFNPKDGISLNEPYLNTNFSSTEVLNNFDNLKLGMHKNEVEKIIGRPINVYFFDSLGNSKYLVVHYSENKNLNTFILKYNYLLLELEYNKNLVLEKKSRYWVDGD